MSLPVVVVGLLKELVAGIVVVVVGGDGPSIVPFAFDVAADGGGAVAAVAVAEEFDALRSVCRKWYPISAAIDFVDFDFANAKTVAAAVDVEDFAGHSCDIDFGPAPRDQIWV